MTIIASKGVVLVVEDDPTLQRLISKHLTSLQFEVVAVAEGNAAIEFLNDRVPVAICIDAVLPRGSGYELCEQIRKTSGFSKIPILLMSERLLPEDRAHGEEAGANAFLPKPFTRDQLIRQIRGLLDRQPLSMRTLRAIN